MKKIALPTRNGNIDDHFGHCAFYTIITVNDNNEVAKTQPALELNLVRQATVYQVAYNIR